MLSGDVCQPSWVENSVIDAVLFQEAIDNPVPAENLLPPHQCSILNASALGSIGILVMNPWMPSRLSFAATWVRNVLHLSWMLMEW